MSGADDTSQRRSAELLRQVAEGSRLREGPEGVRLILKALHERGTLPAGELAALVRLPVPVVAAVRGELRKKNLAERDPKGVALTDEGRSLVREMFGGDASPLEPAASAEDSDSSNESLLQIARDVAADRPDVDVALDQAKATPETITRRIEYLHSNDMLAGRRVLFLGDDDFTSAAAVRYLEHAGAQGHVAAVDIDERIVTRIGAFGVTTGVYDARDPVPKGLAGTFDVVVTDPPYTAIGAELFLSRALDAVGGEPGAHCLFCFGHLGPETMRSVQAAINEIGWVIEEWLPGFNRYEGAGVLAGISLAAHLIAAEGAAPVVTGRYDGPLYTADVRPMVRTYRCEQCRNKWDVGPGQKWKTVAELKRVSCPKCGHEKFRRVSQRPAKRG